MSIINKQPSESDPAINDPIDGAEMQKFEIDGISVDRSPKSGGIWLDKGELAKLLNSGAKAKSLVHELEQLPIEGERSELPDGLTCPRSGVSMVIHTDPGGSVRFGVSPETGGVYFSSGDLASLAELSFWERLKLKFSK